MRGGCRTGIELVLNSKVQSVSHQRLTVAGPGGKTEDIPFGAGAAFLAPATSCCGVRLLT